jgi:methyltransferase (TIGR00027 family)
MQIQERNILLSDVEETGLLTLYCKAIESQSDSPIMIDEKAIDAVNQLDPILERSESKLLRNLVSRKIDKRAVVHIALRAQKYDAIALDFMKSNQTAVIVNLGCGMDTRYFRIDDGNIRFFDVDLPDMIAFKQKIFPVNTRYQMIPKSIFDYGWMDVVEKSGRKKIMFQAEGVFMYLDPEKVRQLVLDIRERFPGSELVCEVVRKQWTSGAWGKMASMKMTRRLNMGKQAGFNFGLDHPKEMESWHPGIQFLSQWSYFESKHEKLGYMRMFGKSKYFKETQYTVHYKLN